MKANPGGNIGASDVVGRDELIAHLWQILKSQSVVLSAERRMGKTCIIRKMKEEAPEGTIAVFHDLERVGTPAEFVRGVLGDIENHLARTKKISNQARELRNKLSGMKLGILQVPSAVEPHWKELLLETLRDLSAHKDRLVIFFWDEVPLMLDKIKRQAGAQEAMDLLDTLRSLRQMSSNLRMVFTGSIGLHHVISSLRKDGYANSPVNDMRREEVLPLSIEAGKDLACRLIEGEKIAVDDSETAGRMIACSVDCIPYFIHHVVGRAARDEQELSPPVIEEIVLKGLTSSLDAWDMRHYRERIDIYFDPDDRPIALKALDLLAQATEPMPFSDLFNLIKAEMVTGDSEQLRRILSLLKNDHYLEQDLDGAFRFKFPMIQRWWKLDRGG